MNFVDSGRGRATISALFFTTATATLRQKSINSDVLSSLKNFSEESA
jgi:hypothetical protein